MEAPLLGIAEDGSFDNVDGAGGPDVIALEATLLENTEEGPVDDVMLGEAENASFESSMVENVEDERFGNCE